MGGRWDLRPRKRYISVHVEKSELAESTLHDVDCRRTGERPLTVGIDGMFQVRVIE